MSRENSISRYGTALIVSGPSGAGKTTVCRQLLDLESDVHFSVSCTTRPPRAGEQDGLDYYFLTHDEFEKRIAADAFLEHAEVHGHLYGTLRQETAAFINEGRDVLLDIDVQGARQVRRQLGDDVLARCAVFVFLGPPSFAEMERRLRRRATDAESDIQRRLDNARGELEHWRNYDFVVVNDRVEHAVTRLRAILAAARCAVTRFPSSPWGPRSPGGIA